MLRRQVLPILCGLLMSAQSFGATPVETHGALRVSGTHIVGSVDSQPVQVAGMSLYWTAWGGEKFYNRQVVDYLVRDFRITLIRPAMGVAPSGVDGYLAQPDIQAGYVNTIVNAAIADGIYVIVDWHDHDANKHVDKAKTFFSQMAQTYKDTPNVIWEIWNEPDMANGTGPGNADSWNDVKQYAEQIIPVIRQYSSNLIIVGTPTWSQDVNVASADPLPDSNLAYTLHFYAGTHGDTLRMKADTAISRGAALFITEFGLSLSSGNGGVFPDATTKWLDWADERGLSWANWSLSDKAESSAALVGGAPVTGKWTDANLTESGKWIRTRLRSRPYPYDTLVDLGDTVLLPNRIEAESFITKSDELKAESVSDTGGGQNLSYTTQGSWAEYHAKVAKTGGFTVKARVASEMEGGTLSIKVNGSTKATLTVGKTGGWQSWTTTEPSPEFLLPSGGALVRVEWSGSASSLINLNWIEFNQTSVGVNKSPQTRVIAGSTRFSVRSGFISFNASPDVKRVSLLTPSGRMLSNIQAHSGKMEMPSGKGLYLLRFEKKSGATGIFPVIGY